jgi:shikimate kinase
MKLSLNIFLVVVVQKRSHTLIRTQAVKSGERMQTVREGMRMKHKNIVLTGIMGCGKTTIGRILSEKLRIEFIDLDQYIEQKWGNITELFKKGEEYFRDIESQSVVEVSNKDGVVIATGGGVVKRNENVIALKKNGLIFFIDRPLEDILSDIDTSERPLLKEGKDRLIQIFKKRYNLYISTCDVHIKNTGDIQSILDEVIKQWKKINKKT